MMKTKMFLYYWTRSESRVMEIIHNSDGVDSAECRNET